jgi:hypothetical protein
MRHGSVKSMVLVTFLAITKNLCNGYFRDFRASPRIRMSNASKAPINAQMNGSPPCPTGCSIRVPIKYPMNVVRSIPTNASNNEELSLVSDGLLIKGSSIQFYKFSNKDVCRSQRDLVKVS